MSHSITEAKKQTGTDLGLGMLEWFHNCDHFLVSELWWAVRRGTRQFHRRIKSQDTHADSTTVKVKMPRNADEKMMALCFWTWVCYVAPIALETLCTVCTQQSAWPEWLRSLKKCEPEHSNSISSSQLNTLFYFRFVYPFKYCFIFDNDRVDCFEHGSESPVSV
jgi:hypothetical protein